MLVKNEFWNFEEKSIANSRYRSLLINSSTTITFKLYMLPWQRSEKHRNATFCNFLVYFKPFNIIFNYRPTRRTIPYYEIIMKYHPEILYAKYHFVRCVGWHLIILKCIQKWSKMTQKCKMCSIYGSSGRCHGNACRINEVLVLVFNRGDIWLF